MKPNWIKLLYDKRLALTKPERQHLQNMVEHGEVQPQQLEVVLIALLLRSQQLHKSNGDTQTDSVGIKENVSSIRVNSNTSGILTMSGDCHRDIDAGILFLASIIAATLGAKVLIPRHMQYQCEHWLKTLKKFGVNEHVPLWGVQHNLNQFGWAQATTLSPKQSTRQLIQRISQLLPKYNTMLFPELLCEGVDYIHLCVCHTDYLEPAAEIIRALEFKKAIIYCNYLPNSLANSNILPIIEINNSDIINNQWRVSDFDLPASSIALAKNFNQDQWDVELSSILEGKLQCHLACDIIMMASSALYACGLCSSLREASQRVIQSIVNRRPRQLIEKMASLNWQDSTSIPFVRGH